MLGTACVRGDKGKVDLRLHDRGQLALGLFRCLLEPLERHLVLAEIDSLVLLELVGQPPDDAVIEVVSAKERVSVRGLHLEDALTELEDRDIEGTAAQVVHRDGLVLLLIETIGE